MSFEKLSAQSLPMATKNLPSSSLARRFSALGAAPSEVATPAFRKNTPTMTAVPVSNTAPFAVRVRMPDRALIGILAVASLSGLEGSGPDPKLTARRDVAELGAGG